MAGPLPEERVGRPVARMHWDCTSFLHWPYDPGSVQPLLPSELRPDTLHGSAWVSITPFVMRDVRPPGLRSLPRVGTFPETNVRTYVRHRGTGQDGLWFLSLDTTRVVALAARAAIGVPYAWSRMSVTRDAAQVLYVTHHRRVPREHASSRIGVVPGEPVSLGDRTPLDHFLTGRWRAFSRRAGRLFCTPVEHEPWPLQRASTTVLQSGLLPAVGLPAPGGDPVVHYAATVDVRLGASRLAG